MQVDERILGNDAMGPLTTKILQIYWDLHGCAALSLKVPYKNKT